ncbi:hypothetical protein C0Q70_00464 [Pomacea canaliculata]|uniref:Major facilitator superfamily (MFS) profile domain-containing protein n=1 Tax=Pomacea canaliculata TaxID=400727 RepID=A0A2T7PWR2_POMCA|nr:hypothetical protein C0Q70_00464 [Pomacea canaliculata]
MKRLCDSPSVAHGANLVGLVLVRGVRRCDGVRDVLGVCGGSDLVVPPAGAGRGWGWFVLLGAFVINIVVGGTSFSFGVMYVHLLKEFQQSKSATAWVASILYCVSLLLGPVASTLTVRFGLRKVTIAAGLVTTAGFLASALAPSLWVLYFTFGVVVGAGFAVCDVTASVAVAYYFRKRRALATGLSECGTGIGTFAFPPLCEALVDTYGWRGAFVLMGGIALHVTVCGALFRPLDAFDRLAGSPVVWILRLLAQSRSVTLRR